MRSRRLPVLVIALLAGAAGCEPAPAPDVSAPAPANDSREAVEHFRGEAGPSVEIPRDFPADLPLLPGARPMAHVSSGEQGRLVMFVSDDEPDAVLSQLRSAWQREGWRFAHETVLDGEQLVAFTKGSRRASIALAATREGCRVTIATKP